MSALSGEAIPKLEEHIPTCLYCQKRLAQTRQFLSVFRAAAVQPDAYPVPRQTRVLVPRNLPLIAASALAAALLIFLVAKKPGPSDFAPATVILQATRGAETGARVAAGRTCILVFDATPGDVGANSEIEVVDLVGNHVLAVPGRWNDGRLTAAIGKLGFGSYWVRIYRNPAKQLIAEYGLRAE